MSLTSYQTAPPCNKGKRTNSFQIPIRFKAFFQAIEDFVKLGHKNGVS
jgi:hypothetical protein